MRERLCLMTATVVKRAWPKKVLDDQENSYNVFSGKVTSLTVKFRFEFLLY